MPLFVSFIGIISSVEATENGSSLSVVYNGDNRDKTFLCDVKVYGKTTFQPKETVYVTGLGIFNGGQLQVNADVLTRIKDSNVPISTPIIVCLGTMEGKSTMAVEQYFRGENASFKLQVAVRENLKVAKYLKEGVQAFVTMKFKNGALEIQQVQLQKKESNVIRANDLLKDNGDSTAADLVANFIFNEAEEPDEDVGEREVPEADANEGANSRKRGRGRGKSKK